MSKPNPFEGKEILSIQVIAGQGKIGRYHTDGTTFGIVEIIDKSLEYEDSILSIYHCLDEDGKIVKVLENCPVDITYTDNEEEYRKKVIENTMPKFNKEYLEGLIIGYCDHPIELQLDQSKLSFLIKVSEEESEANLHKLKENLQEYIPAGYLWEIIKETE